MGKPRNGTAEKILQSLPPLPLTDGQWQAVFDALGISGQQSAVAKLMLRDASNSEIATILGISDGSVKQYQQRLSRRTGANSRMQLAMRVLAVSHEIRSCRCRPTS